MSEWVGTPKIAKEDHCLGGPGISPLQSYISKVVLEGTNTSFVKQNTLLQTEKNDHLYVSPCLLKDTLQIHTLFVDVTSTLIEVGLLFGSRSFPFRFLYLFPGF